MVWNKVKGSIKKHRHCKCKVLDTFTIRTVHMNKGERGGNVADMGK